MDKCWLQINAVTNDAKAVGVPSCTHFLAVFPIGGSVLIAFVFVPPQCSVLVDGVDNSSPDRKHIAKIIPAIANFVRTLPIETSVLIALVLVPAKYAVISNQIDDAIAAGEDTLLTRHPTVSDSFGLIAIGPRGRSIAGTVVSVPVKRSVSPYRINDRTS